MKRIRPTQFQRLEATFHSGSWDRRGVEHIKALASVDPVLSKVESLQEELKQPIETKPEKGQVFLSMKDPGVVLKDIGIVFKKLDPSKWATLDYAFRIAEAGVGSRPPSEEKPTVTSRTKPPDAQEVFKGKSGLYEVWYDKSKWKVGSSTNPAAETGFFHLAGDAQVHVICERQAIPMATLKKAFLGNLERVASDAVVKEEKEISVNNARVTSMIVNFTSEGIGITFYAYLWSGESGAIQFVGVCGQTLFPEFKDDIEKLLNGLVILKP